MKKHSYLLVLTISFSALSGEKCATATEYVINNLADSSLETSSAPILADTLLNNESSFQTNSFRSNFSHYFGSEALKRKSELLNKIENNEILDLKEDTVTGTYNIVKNGENVLITSNILDIEAIDANENYTLIEMMKRDIPLINKRSETFKDNCSECSTKFSAVFDEAERRLYVLANTTCSSQLKLDELKELLNKRHAEITEVSKKIAEINKKLEYKNIEN